MISFSSKLLMCNSKFSIAYKYTRQMQQLLVIINIRNQSNLRFLKLHKQQHEISNNLKKQQGLLRMLQAKQRIALINVKCNAGQVVILNFLK